MRFHSHVFAGGSWQINQIMSVFFCIYRVIGDNIYRDWRMRAEALNLCWYDTRDGVPDFSS